MPFLAGTRTSRSLGLEDKYNVWPSKGAGRKVRQFLDKADDNGVRHDDDNDEGESRAGQRRSRPTSGSKYKHSAEYALVD